MSRERLKEEFAWGVATLLAALLCLALLPLVVLSLLSEHVVGALRGAVR